MKILHLYYDIMNLYGDWANAEILKRALNYHGYQAEVEKKGIGDKIKFDSYGFIYIGSGTERSQRACAGDMGRFKEALTERIEENVYMLATGNSHELFGQRITTSGGETYDTLGLLDFETTQIHSRVTGDVMVTAPFLQEKIIGFINRSGGGQSQCGKGKPFERLFTAAAQQPGGKNENAEPAGEGFRYKNLFGTYMTGPLLVRNPPLLSYFAGGLISAGECAENAGTADEDSIARDAAVFEYQQMAYKSALKELSER